MTLDDRLLSQAKFANGLGIDLKVIAQGKEAILSDLLEIIGEDEEAIGGITYKEGGEKSVPKPIKHRNNLRQELREKVKKYCK